MIICGVTETVKKVIGHLQLRRDEGSSQKVLAGTRRPQTSRLLLKQKLALSSRGHGGTALSSFL